MEAFLADESKLAKTRELLKEVEKGSLEEKTLKMLERTFGCYIMESEEAKKLRGEATKIEGQLESARNRLTLGATINGKFEEMSSVGLRNKVRVDPDEAVRKACFEGLTKIGDFVTENGFVELVKVRNRMAKALGYLDFYDYKVTNGKFHIDLDVLIHLNLMLLTEVYPILTSKCKLRDLERLSCSRFWILSRKGRVQSWKRPGRSLLTRKELLH